MSRQKQQSSEKTEKYQTRAQESTTDEIILLFLQVSVKYSQHINVRRQQGDTQLRFLSSLKGTVQRDKV
jgi:hypothetical protein